MNKQQMEQIIYEEFVNNIYENAKLDLSEEKSTMVEEFMNQIFNENYLQQLADKAKEKGNEYDSVEAAEKNKQNKSLSDKDKLLAYAAARDAETGEDSNLGASAKTGPGSKPDFTPRPAQDKPVTDKSKGDNGPATAGTKPLQDFDADSGAPITLVGLRRCLKSRKCLQRHPILSDFQSNKAAIWDTDTG